MPDLNRIAGTVEVTYNGNVLKVVGNVSYNLGLKVRETLKGPDSVHGYKELPQEPFIEGEGRLQAGSSLTDLVNTTNATVVCTLATGKIIMVSDAWFEGEGTAGSEEATIPFKFCGLKGEEIG